MQLVALRVRDGAWVHMLVYRLENGFVQIRQSSDGARQAICCSGLDTKIRWVKATVHDPSLSFTVFDMQWRCFDLPDGSSVDVWSGDCAYFAEALGACVHR